MKKILMAAAVILVSGTPLSFAATSGNMSTAEHGSRHCTYQGEKWDLCHQDRHKRPAFFMSPFEHPSARK